MNRSKSTSSAEIDKLKKEIKFLEIERDGLKERLSESSTSDPGKTKLENEIAYLRRELAIAYKTRPPSSDSDRSVTLLADLENTKTALAEAQKEIERLKLLQPSPDLSSVR